MKKLIKSLWKYYTVATLISWALYFFVWVCTMFVKLEFVHPFYYFMNIGELSAPQRGKMLALYLFILLMKIVGTYFYATEKGCFKKEVVEQKQEQ